ncbi:MAG: RNA methyltransferase [Acidimicrobiia bacterium]
MRDGDARLGRSSSRVRRLRGLLRDPKARQAERAFVVEGPRAVAAAFERGVAIEGVYVGPGADRAFAALCDRIRVAGIPVYELKEGVLERVGSTVTPQPVLAVAPATKARVDELAPGLVLVAVDVADPGNAGTMLRSAEAAGAAGVVFCGSSVDPYNPKVVRSSAGAIFGVRVVEADDPVVVLDALGARGWRRYGTRPADGTPYDRADLTGSVAVVLGNEARGLADTLPLDDTITIPMVGDAESINVAMAATVLCFEFARQFRARGGGDTAGGGAAGGRVP